MQPAKYNVIRLEIIPGDHHDVLLVPFEALTVNEIIRVCETPSIEPVSDSEWAKFQARKDELMRALDIPRRFIQFANVDEVKEFEDIYEGWMKKNRGYVTALGDVHKEMEGFQDANDRAWTIEDAREAMQRHGIYSDTITINGEVYKAPENLDRATFIGQWSNLEDICQRAETKTESELYAQACATLMMREGERWPGQGKDEDRDAFNARFLKWYEDRLALFMDAPWVSVMGCAAFFFSNSQQFRAIMATYLPRFRTIPVSSRQQVPRIM